MIELHIDELVLHGFPPEGRFAVADGITGELTRLLGERGVPPHAAGADHVAATVERHTPAAVARGIYDSLGGRP